MTLKPSTLKSLVSKFFIMKAGTYRICIDGILAAMHFVSTKVFLIYDHDESLYETKRRTETLRKSGGLARRRAGVRKII
jgi:hypothetical protein